MYIDFTPRRYATSFGGGGSEDITFEVKTKKEGIIGELHLATDQDGSGTIEWCRDRTAKGYGKKIGVEELINLLEQRESGHGE